MKKLIGFVCSVVIALTSIPFGILPIKADAAVFKGSGTANDPYQISSNDDLFKLSELINNEAITETYSNCYYIQTADIDLENKIFPPIATYYGDDGKTVNKKVFGGNYNGNYHKITNLNIDSDKRYAGLFGIVGGYGVDNKECIIKNLSVSGNVKCDEYMAGGVAGEVRQGATIQNCDFTGTVSGKTCVGGIAGQSYCGGNVISCYANAEIESKSKDGSAGGIVGQTQAGNIVVIGSSDPVVVNNYFTGTVVGDISGGICGNSVLNNKRENTIITYNNNYYLNTASNKGVGSDNANGCTKLSNVALKACADMLGSPFVDNDEADGFNDGYPIFEWQSTPYQFKGSGTSDDPYQISSKKEIETMRDLVNSTYFNPVYGHAYYIQTADIDLENESWIPIGLGYDGDDGHGEYNCVTRMFFGVYDGNQHTIYNLNVDKEWYYSGLFSTIRFKQSKVCNLAVYGNVVLGRASGGIAGETHYYSSIENCAFIGNVNGTQYAGGIVGRAYNGATLKNCYHNGSVTSEKNAGGISGATFFNNLCSVEEESIIENCYHANGQVTGEECGAIVGICIKADNTTMPTTIKNCYASKSSNYSERNEAATYDDTMILPDSMLKKIAEYIGIAYVDNTNPELNNGFPVFPWQLEQTVILMGDVNEDGEFSVSDVILLQKWLLAVPNTKLTNWKAANFYEDDKLDVFDLCMMKRALIEQMQ